MKTVSTAVAALAIAVFASNQLSVAQKRAPAEDLYLTNANLVDPATREVRRGNLFIQNGMIVSAPGRPPAGFTGRTLDLNGKWVIPGLVDLHTHTYGNVDTSGKPIDRPNTPGVAVRMLYAGVTAFLDLFGNEDELFNWRQQQRVGDLGGADMFASLTCLTATGAHGTEYGVKARITDSPEQARQAVESLKARRPDVIKIIYEWGSGRRSIDKATLLAAVSAATQNGIKTVVHVSTWQNVRDAVEAGATAVTHTPAGPVPEDLARLMASRMVASIPTLAVQTDFRHFVFEPGVLDNPMARALTTAAVIGAYRSSETIARAESLRERLEAGEVSAFRAVKAMSDAGVRILAGTDSGSVGTLQGYSVHRELIKLVAAGLSPWQALAAATTDAGAFLGLTYGVTQGSEATLVVLDASPIADIRNTQRIAYVIHHGVVVDREGVIAAKVAGLTVAQPPVARVEVRFAPKDYVYLAQENRRFALTNLQLQNVAIVNSGASSVAVDEVLIEILLRNEVVRSERLDGPRLAQRWTPLSTYLGSPGVLAAEDPRFRFNELLGEQPKLADSTTLAPGTAIFVARRFFFLDAVTENIDGKPQPVFPDRVRVSVTGTTPNGERVRGSNEIRIVRYEPRNDYQFPVEGRWYIGSSSSVRSHHRSQPVHEFALDLLQIGEGGRSFRGNGTAHSDYYAFGRDVLAIGDGIVTAIYGDVADTRLRRLNESPDEYRRVVFEPLSARGMLGTGGNQIVIEHPGQEFSTYAHLRSGSVRVKKGDRVRRGQAIAQVGMSGDGYQPHLHIQLTDGPDGNYARGIPLIFANVQAVLFASTLDTDGRRQLQTGEFVETMPTLK